jgi:general secretion pathway protein K
MTMTAIPKHRRIRAAAAGRLGDGDQRGAAVLMALFVATLATLIVSGLFWSQFVVLRTIENQELVLQSRLLLRGAMDWARAILREDQRTTAQDGLTEPWAQGLAETKLDQLGETSELAARASIAGGIEDAQSRFNLRNLVAFNGEVDSREVDSLRKLASLLDVPEAAADLIRLRMEESLQAGFGPADSEDPPARSAGAGGSSGFPPIPLVLPQDLAGIRGITAEVAARLAPYVVVLDAPTPVNVNTASPEVIAARIPGMTLSAARALVAQRERLGYFRDLGDVKNYVREDFSEKDLAVSSRYFVIRGQVKLDRANTRIEALVKRGDSWQQRVEMLWQREL